MSDTDITVEQMMAAPPLYTVWVDFRNGLAEPHGLGAPDGAGSHRDDLYLYPVGTQADISAILPEARRMYVHEPSWRITAEPAPIGIFTESYGAVMQPCSIGAWLEILRLMV